MCVYQCRCFGKNIGIFVSFIVTRELRTLYAGFKRGVNAILTVREPQGCPFTSVLSSVSGVPLTACTNDSHISVLSLLYAIRTLEFFPAPLKNAI